LITSKFQPEKNPEEPARISLLASAKQLNHRAR
jgi:hypothetical protein